MTGVMFKVGLGFGAICLLLAVLAFLGWRGAGANARALDTRGEMAEATVIDLQIINERRRPASNSSVRRESYFVTVSFGTGSVLDNSFSLNTSRAEVRKDFFQSLAMGQKIPVRYLPGTDVVEIEPGWTAGNSTAAGWAALAFGCLGALVIALTVTAGLREQRLATRGIVRQAEILAVEPKGGFWVMSFRWLAADGQTRTGTATPRKPKGPLEGLEPGQRIEIREDPANPARARWVKDLPAGSLR